MKRHPQKASVPVVVDVGAQISEDRRCCGGKAGEDFDETAFFSDEDSSIRGELNSRWICQSTEYDLFAEPR
jgi:hypothetical protein